MPMLLPFRKECAWCAERIEFRSFGPVFMLPNGCILYSPKWIVFRKWTATEQKPQIVTLLPQQSKCVRVQESAEKTNQLNSSKNAIAVFLAVEKVARKMPRKIPKTKINQTSRIALSTLQCFCGDRNSKQNRLLFSRCAGPVAIAGKKSSNN